MAEHLSPTPDPNTVLSELLDAASQAEAQGIPVDDAVKADLLAAARFVNTEDVSHGGFTIPGTDEWMPGDTIRTYSYMTIDSEGNQAHKYSIDGDIAQRVLKFQRAHSTIETEGDQQAPATESRSLPDQGGSAAAEVHRRRRQRQRQAGSRADTAATDGTMDTSRTGGSGHAAAAGGRHGGAGGGAGHPPRGSAPRPPSPSSRGPESRSRRGEALPDELELLQALGAELDLVPINARRVLDLQRFIKSEVSRNEDGAWVRNDGRAFVKTITNGRGRETVLATSEADAVLDTLLGNEAKGIVGKLQPEYWLIKDDEKRREFADVMFADMLSFRHTSDADERRRWDGAQRIALAGDGYNSYLEPFGEGLLEEMEAVERLKKAPLHAALDAAQTRIEHEVNKVRAWRSFFKERGAQIITDRMNETGMTWEEAEREVLSAPKYAAIRREQGFHRLRERFERPISAYADDGHPRSRDGIARDLKARDEAKRELMGMLNRGERALIEKDRVDVSQPKGWATQEANKLIAKAERAARSTGREGIYHDNLSSSFSEQAVKAYEAAGHTVNPNLGITEEQGAVMLRWYQAQVLARMKLNNEFLALANVPMLAVPIVGMEGINVRGARPFDPSYYPGWGAIKAGTMAAYDADSSYIDQVHRLATDEIAVHDWLLLTRGLDQGSDDPAATESDKQQRVRFNKAKAAVKQAMRERSQDVLRGMVPLDVAGSSEQRERAFSGSYDWSRWYLPKWAVEELIREGKLARSGT